MKTASLFNALLVVAALLASTTLLPAQTITIDGNANLANDVNKKVGININYVSDENTPKFRQALNDLGVTSIRCNQGFGDYWRLDPNNPDSARLTVVDPKIWYIGPLLATSDGYWRDKLDVSDMAQVTNAVGGDAYYVLGIAPVEYTGTADKFLAGKNRAQRIELVIQYAIDLLTYARDNNYPVDYVEIGNETELTGALVDSGIGRRWTAESYAEVALAMAKAIRAFDPSIKIGVNGGMRGETFVNAWFDTVLPKVRDYIDFVVTHQYSFFLDGYDDWRTSDNFTFDSSVRDTRKSINEHAPGLPIAVTEFSGWLQGTKPVHWHGLQTLNMMGSMLSGDDVQTVQLWNSQWVGNDRAQAFYNSDYSRTPLGNAVAFFTRFAQSRMIDNGEASRVDYFATKDPATGATTVFLINRESSTKNVTLALNNYSGATTGEAWAMQAASSNPNATSNTISKSGDLTLSGSGASRSLSVSVPPVSALAVVLDGGGTNPEPEPTGELVVRARGITGTEGMAIVVDGQTTQEFIVTTSLADYSAPPAPAGATVRVAFTGGQGAAADLIVDYLTRDGITLQAEDQTINTGAWNPQTESCGGAQGERLACTGYIEFGTSADEPVAGSSPLVINAQGECGGEVMELHLDGTMVDQWTLTASPANYTYEQFDGGQVSLHFVNDRLDQAAACADYNLTVDYLEVCGTRYQTETVASITAQCCTEVKDKLYTNGSFNFGTLSCPDAMQSPQAAARGAVVEVYPNPATEQLTVRGGSEPYQVSLYDATGRLVLRQRALRGSVTLSVAHLRAGVYVMKVDRAQGTQTQRKVILE